jgi:hypothetical protein
MPQIRVKRIDTIHPSVEKVGDSARQALGGCDAIRSVSLLSHENDEATLDFNWAGDANFPSMDKALRVRNLERVAPVPTKSKMMR